MLWGSEATLIAEMLSNLFAAFMLIGLPFFVLYAIYHDYKYKRSPKGIEAARQRKLREDQRKAEAAESAARHAEWAEAHPTAKSLLMALIFSALTAFALWVAWWYSDRDRMLAVVGLLFGGVAALSTLYWVLAAIFEEDRAMPLMGWIGGGGLAVSLASVFLGSVHATIVLGVIVIVWVLLRSVEAIKQEIRKRE